MSQTRSAAKKFLPTAGVTAAGVTAGAAGIWAWRRRRNPPVETRSVKRFAQHGVPHTLDDWEP